MRAGAFLVKACKRRKFNPENELTPPETGRTIEGGSALWGRHGFDGGKDPRDACRAPLTRKSDGTSVNCGYSVRSRSLISCERLPRPRLMVGGQMPLSRLAAGWRLGALS